MNKHMIEVMQRRNELVAKIASQRGQVAEIGRRLQTPLALADQGLSIARFMRAHPALVGGVAALLIARRRGVTGLLKGGWRAWKAYRYLAALAAKLP